MNSVNGKFQTEYYVFSYNTYHNETRDKISHLEKNDKIMLPESQKEFILQMMKNNIPIFFNIKSKSQTKSKSVCCSLESFSQKRRTIYVPQWMIKHLCIKEGDRVYVNFITLKIGTSVTFKVPEEFKTFDDTEAILADALVNRSVLTSGEKIIIDYEPVGTYEIMVKELVPNNSVNLINCNMSILLE